MKSSSLIEKQIERIENKIIKLENKRKQREIIKYLFSYKILTYQFFKVPINYYSLTLQERSQILNTSIPNLCKSIIIQNSHFISQNEVNNEVNNQESSQGSNQGEKKIDLNFNNVINQDEISENKYYCIVIQYIHKLNL